MFVPRAISGSPTRSRFSTKSYKSDPCFFQKIGTNVFHTKSDYRITSINVRGQLQNLPVFGAEIIRGRPLLEGGHNWRYDI